MFDLTTTTFDAAMTPSEFDQSKVDLQTLQSKFSFLHPLDETDTKGMFKTSNLEKTLMREVLSEFDNAAPYLGNTKQNKDEVTTLLLLAEQLSFHEDQLLQTYNLVRRNRMLAEAKAYRRVSSFRDSLVAIVKGGQKAAAPIVARIAAFFKKRSDAIKAANKAKKEAAEAAKAAAEAVAQ